MRLLSEKNYNYCRLKLMVIIEALEEGKEMTQHNSYDFIKTILNKLENSEVVILDSRQSK